MQDRKAAGYEGWEEEGGLTFFPPILHILPPCDPAYPVIFPRRAIIGAYPVPSYLTFPEIFYRICRIAKRQDMKDGRKKVTPFFPHPSYPAALRSCISCYFSKACDYRGISCYFSKACDYRGISCYFSKACDYRGISCFFCEVTRYL